MLLLGRDVVVREGCTTNGVWFPVRLQLYQRRNFISSWTRIGNMVNSLSLCFTIQQHLGMVTRFCCSLVIRYSVFVRGFKIHGLFETKTLIRTTNKMQGITVTSLAVLEQVTLMRL